MRQPDSKQAEKRYLGRTGASAWEREKPYSPRGDDTFAESISLLHDFCVAMTLLQPSVDDRIVDLGAGGGWCSDLLQRLNRTSIAVDISVEMLRVARQRPTRWPIAAVAGDFEHLPFRDGSFDKAICLNAIHHIPDIETAVREVSRILSPDGVAVFSEPGIGHSSKPWSVAATSDFGVLEQDILVEPFIATCRAAGFADVRVCPMVYIIPGFQLSPDEWRSWKRLPRTKRPLRAMEKMWRAVLEFFGAGKSSTLFPETFAMRIVRQLQQPVAEHPYILAAKRELPDWGRPRYYATIDIVSLASAATPGAIVGGTVRVKNGGSTPWRARREEDRGQVCLGIQLLDRSGRMLMHEFARVDLPADVLPGDSQSIEVRFQAPLEPGDYLLKFDCVAEGVTWFELSGSPVVVRPLDVAPNAEMIRLAKPR